MSTEPSESAGTVAPFPLRLRRSQRAQRLRLIVRADGIECVLPATCPERLAHDFIRRHHAWLVRKYAEAVVHAPARTFWDDASRSDELSFPLHGQPTPFRVHAHVSGASRFGYDGAAFSLLGPAAPLQVESMVYGWARGWLAQPVAALLRDHAAQLGVQPRQTRIKRMRTRWGSCGAANDINLNWVLIAAPLPVLEYVVVHELCHIRHRDHSARFWQLVATHLPDFQQSRRWLKAEGGRLLQRFATIR